MTRRTLLLGPPGCGKTTRLLTELERTLQRGVPPDRIGFLSFTRAAVREARERACERFNLVPDDLPYFRTVHSLAFRLLGLRRSDVFGREDLALLAELTGEELTGHSDLDAPTLGERGDALLFLDQTARNRLETLDTTWDRHGATIDGFRLRRFVAAYAGLRRDLGKLDFTDLLEACVGLADPLIAGERVADAAPIEVAFVDEAQDLTPLQWRVLARALASVRELWVAGDDDQCIYSWAGADVDALLRFEGEREVLDQSYRLPLTVHELAENVSSRIARRNPKRFSPRDHLGTVDWLGDAEEVDLSTGEWLLLARTRRQLTKLATIARDQGVTYAVMGASAVNQATVRLILDWEALRRGAAISREAAERLSRVGAVREPVPDASDVRATDLGLTGALPIWHDALIEVPLDEREYLLSCLRRGEKLTAPPRVRVSTIHGAKGAEADHVLLVTDLTKRVWEGVELDPDAEQRVLYVGVTRARERLQLVVPSGTRAYEL